MTILEKGMDLRENSIYNCDCNNKGVSKCKGCEDNNASVEQAKEVYEEQ